MITLNNIIITCKLMGTLISGNIMQADGNGKFIIELDTKPFKVYTVMTEPEITKQCKLR